MVLVITHHIISPLYLHPVDHASALCKDISSKPHIPHTLQPLLSLVVSDIAALLLLDIGNSDTFADLTYAPLQLSRAADVHSGALVPELSDLGSLRP